MFLINLTFHANAAHVREGTQTRKLDKYWEDMLDTLISERGQGKIVGPFAALLPVGSSVQFQLTLRA